MTTLIPQVDASVNHSINAEFIRIEVPNGPDGGIYYFSSSYKAETIPVDGTNELFALGETDTTLTVPMAPNNTATVVSATFTPLGGLVGVSGHQRDLAITSYDTTVTLQGIDQTKVGVILSSSVVDPDTGLNKLIQLKGSKIQIWRGFYDQNFVLDGVPVLRYTGIITSYSIQEDRVDLIDAFTLQLHCSSYKKVLENRISGRHTNPTSWNTLNGVTILATDPAYDAAMDNVAALNNATFNFGQKMA